MQLSSATEDMEVQQSSLVKDCVNQLQEMSNQIRLLSDELSIKTEMTANQRDKIGQLTHKIIALEKHLDQVYFSNTSTKNFTMFFWYSVCQNSVVISNGVSVMRQKLMATTFIILFHYVT